MIKQAGVLLGLLLLAMGAWGQTTAPDSTWEQKFFQDPAQTLPRLVDAATKHSFELGATRLDKAVAEQDVQLARKNILNSVQLTNTIGYGNVSNVTVADQSFPTGSSVTATKRYYTGVNLTLPLDRLVGRPNQIARQRLLAEKQDQLIKAREQTVAQQVLEQYQQVVLGRNLLALRQQAYQAARVNDMLAEKLFKDGSISLAESALIHERYLAAAVEQEKALSSYTTAFAVLELLVGGKVSEIIMR